MLRFCFAILFCVALAAAAPSINNRRSLNDRPIIGVLSMEVAPTEFAQYGNYTSHIAASYVKYLESAGARVVPIMIYKDESYYQDIVEKVNGVFIPGAPTVVGAAESRLAKDLDISGYGMAGAYLYKHALLQNNQGNYFPMWGTCLGFQLITLLSGALGGAREDFRTLCHSNNQIIPLELSSDIENSRLFGDAPEAILKILKEDNVTAHFHNYCVTEESMEKYGITSWWRILSRNHDFNGLEFVSTIEAKDYPLYASIYHPEKNGFEWTDREDSKHNANAVLMMQYYANFFVNEARKNGNSYPTLRDEQSALIYNYNPIFSGDKTVYQQVYLF